MTAAPRFRPEQFSDMQGWREDAHLDAFAALRRSAFRALVKPYRTGSLGLDAAAFAEAFAEAHTYELASDDEARLFFERHFLPFEIVPETGSGHVTGFYEPVAEASPVRTDRFRYPLYARPDDLVDIDDANRPAGFDPYFAFGRLAADGSIVEYFDRQAIEQGALAGRRLEIAWLADRVDLFFIHVQGAARLAMPDGTVRRVTYDGKSGHRFTGPGRVLIDSGELPAAGISMQSVRGWLRDNPGRVDEILWRNRSFIFFRDAPVDDPALGPLAAAKVPLGAGRSMAVDRLLHTFATPFFIDAPSLDAFGSRGFRRLMIAQDTGSAIIGPARGDLFTGSGHAAGEIAGVINHPASFHILVPRPIAERFT